MSAKDRRSLAADDEEYEKFSYRTIEHDYSDADQLEAGQRWSTWDQSVALARGPEPRPDWLVTDAAALDTDLGLIKTGKEADVFLLERAVPDGGPSCLLASKRYRSGEHRMFQRDAGYLEGRRMRRSRENRAMANKTSFGRELVANQWAIAEFGALVRLFNAGAPVPYPVQVLGTEVLIEYLGDEDGQAAPRLVQMEASKAELRDLWEQLVDAMVLLARHGLAHGDLSPYNILVHASKLYLIDLPQVVDIVINPQGIGFLQRDAINVSQWFASRGLAEAADADQLFATLLAEVGI